MGGQDIQSKPGDFSTTDKVCRLRTFLEKRVKGQPKAIEALCKVYNYDLTLRQLEKRQGPIGVLMFLGPSCVGKTESARALAEYFMGSVDSLVKVDCSAFSQPHMIHSLIGAPHSYIGYCDKTLLSQQSLLERIKRTSPALKGRDLPIRDLLERKARRLNSEIENIQYEKELLEEEMISARRIVGALTEHHHTLHVDDKNVGSVAELLRDRNTREKILSMTSSDAKDILEEDLSDPSEDAAILLEFTAKMKQTIRSYRMAQAKESQLLEKLSKVKKDLSHIGVNTHNLSEEKGSGPETKFVILFDEIEKAHFALHQLLLQIMEEGQLTLANGSITNLRDAFIVMTSNVGSKAIGDVLKDKGIGFKAANSKGDDILGIAEREMEKAFQPEFRRRIDEIVVFRPLSKDTLYEILDYHIELFSFVLSSKGIKLIIDQKVKDVIVAQSLHRPEVGASLLDHKFKSLIKIPLGEYISNNKIKGIVRVSLESDGRVRFFAEK